jgi:anti-sigma regulatory factor (Ser/Thr protein kinase)/predicted ArsR family transcriptional regulator
MDWYLAQGDARAARELRRQISGLLRRHASEPAAVDDAELVIEELLGNALRHSDGPVWVSLEWGGTHPTLAISDLGQDFALDTTLPEEDLAEGGRGLFLAAHLSTDLRRTQRRGGGNLVSARLDVERPAEVSIAPRRRTSGVLPHLDEADEHGTFGKETFLRALVVQLALVVQEQHGPAAAETAVAQVGTDVGGQMEAAYRLAEDLEGRLTPEHLADCYVRLKHAIDGGFRAVEITPERIVLENTACPFGPVVQRAPSLCRMTSSVFGGIAARNADGATVVLEERIALGDPQCRVVVHLGPPTVGDGGPGHGYPAPTEAEPR